MKWFFNLFWLFYFKCICKIFKTKALCGCFYLVYFITKTIKGGIMLKRLSIILLTVASLCMAASDKPVFAYEPHPIKGLANYSTYWKTQGALKYAHSPSTIYFDHIFHQ